MAKGIKLRLPWPIEGDDELNQNKKGSDVPSRMSKAVVWDILETP